MRAINNVCNSSTAVNASISCTKAARVVLTVRATESSTQRPRYCWGHSQVRKGILFLITGSPTRSVGGQTSNDGWCLSSSVVCNAAGGRAGRRARGRSGGLHSTAGQYGHVPLGRHLIVSLPLQLWSIDYRLLDLDIISHFPKIYWSRDPKYIPSGITVVHAPVSPIAICTPNLTCPSSPIPTIRSRPKNLKMGNVTLTVNGSLVGMVTGPKGVNTVDRNFSVRLCAY